MFDSVKILSESCKRSLFLFMRVFWDVIIPETPKWNWHIPFICNELEKVGMKIVNREKKEYDLLINVPPGTTKSTIATIMFPAWLWAVDPTIRVINSSYSSSIATEHSVKTKDIIMSPRYLELFPHVQIRHDRSGKQAYGTTKNGTRDVTSTGSGSTGRHAHVILIDDPQSPKQAESDAHRIQAIEKVKELASRKVDKDISVTITIMQRLNKLDVSNHIVESGGVRHIRLPATLDDKTPPLPIDAIHEGRTLREWYEAGGGLLDPERLGHSALNEMLISLGSRGYAGQMMQSPVVQEGDIVKKEWFNIITRSEYLKRKKKRSSIQFFVDTAYTEKSENDPTGIIAVDSFDGNLYILNRAKVRKEFPDLIKWLPTWVKSNGYDSESSIRIEPKASGLSVIQSLRDETDLNITNTETPKDSKKARLHAVTPKIEARRIYLIEGHWNEEFIDEVSGFPNAPHDEDVDLLVYAINHFLTGSADEEYEYSNLLW